MRKTESSNERSNLEIVLVLTALLAYPAFIHLSFAFDRLLLVTGMWLAVAAVGLAMAIRRGSASLLLLFFVIEYRLRPVCLPRHEHLSFRAFCRLLASTDLRTLAR